MAGEFAPGTGRAGSVDADGVQIVCLAPDEWAAYRELRLRALSEEPQAFGESYANAVGLPEARWRRRLEEARPGSQRVLLFARRGERLVGMIAAMPYSSDGVAGASGAEETREARIISVFVAAEERGRGTGGRLMEEVLRALRESGRYERVSLTVNKGQATAVGLYRRFGFEVVGEVDAMLGDGAVHRELIMERGLPHANA